MTDSPALTPFGDALWLADGPAIVAAAGFHYPTRMAAVRLRRGEVWLWSPVALTEELHAEVAALGPVRHLVAPNALHHMAMADWQAAFPQAQLWAPEALARKRPDLRIDGKLGTDVPPWTDEIVPLALPGNRVLSEWAFFHRASCSLLVTDILQNLPGNWFRGWRGLVARADLMLGDKSQVPRKFRLGALGQRAALKAAVAQMLEWPVERVVMAHGTPVTRDGQAFLRQAFDWL